MYIRFSLQYDQKCGSCIKAFVSSPYNEILLFLNFKISKNTREVSVEIHRHRHLQSQLRKWC